PVQHPHRRRPRLRRAAIPAPCPRRRLPDPAHTARYRAWQPVSRLRARLGRPSQAEHPAVTADPGQYLPVAHAAADLARDLIRTSHPGAFTEKADRDLVSDVDLAVERAVRQHLHQATPAIGFLGEEEGGADDTGTGWLWTLDPIDGTSN